MRRRRWWMAGAIGFFAALTRAEGVILLIPFAIEWWSAYRFEARRALSKLWAGVLIPLGLFVYMAYLWVLRGDPLYFSHVQVHWNRHFAWPWVSVLDSFAKIAHATTPLVIANETIEIAFTALMIGLLIVGWKMLRPSYIAYMALSILIPMCTSSLMSMPRFALVLFPMYAIMARLAEEKPWINNAIVAFSLPLLGLFTVLFADWYWVA
jgi:asparagine N-glycosylation enzyme membrane subunit Stt3